MNRNAFRLLLGLAAAGWLIPSSRAADSITNFGLVHMPLGQAVVSEDGNSYVNLTTNRGDGVSIFLGESDSGIFFNPSVSWREPRDFIHGDIYGELNGMTNQRLASARGVYAWWGWGDTNWVHGDEWDLLWEEVGEYGAGVDLSPLGGSSLTVIAYDGDQVMGVFSNATQTFNVSNPEWDWGNPLRRVAPFWRMPDGSVGALFEFWWRTRFGPFDAIGNRYFVRCEDPTNVVGTVSRLDVTSFDLPATYIPPPTNFGTGLTSFELADVRLGMFHRAHRALDHSLFHATNRHLTITHDHPASQPKELQIAGTAVELGRSTAFQAELLPLELPAEGDALTLTGIGNAAGIENSELGTMRVENTNETLQISAQFSIAPRFAQIIVLAGGVPVGTNGVPRDDVWVTASTSPRIIASGLLARTLSSLPGFIARFEEATTFTTSAGEEFTGDEVRLLASDPAHFETLDTAVISTLGLSSFTITGESTASFVPPWLSLALSGTNVVLRWPDPNEIFEVERVIFQDGSEPIPPPFLGETVTNRPTFLHDFRSLVLPFDPEVHEFFRLRHGQPRPPPIID